jgi:hypothetical protein
LFFGDFFWFFVGKIFAGLIFFNDLVKELSVEFKNSLSINFLKVKLTLLGTGSFHKKFSVLGNVEGGELSFFFVGDHALENIFGNRLFGRLVGSLGDFL